MIIFQSASKIAFLLLAVALVVLTFMKIVEAKDFITLTGMAFTYYFVKKDQQPPVDSQQP